MCVLCGDLSRAWMLGWIPAPPTPLMQMRFDNDEACASLLIPASPLQSKQAAPSICLGGCLVVVKQENAKSAGWLSKNVARFGTSQQAAVPFELWVQGF